MNNNEMKNSEFETKLRNKMDELASSVDCFDKICSKAFPEKSEEYSDCEYTVCDVENVTGKRTFFRFFPALAAAAALIVCVIILPQSGSFLNKVFSNLGNKEDKQSFRSLIAEINEETSNGNYSYYDCTLEEYVKNDILIAPLYGCPFEERDDKDLRVRVFVRMYGDIPTNQVYAVEYEGDYSEANYLAAAESKAKLTEEELEYMLRSCLGNDAVEDSANVLESEKIIPYIKNHTLKFIENSFDPSLYGVLTDAEGSAVSAASFTYNCLYKHDDKIYPLSNEIIYYHENSDNTSDYLYDIYSAYNNDGELELFDSLVFEDAWDSVVYYNGLSAAAEKELSRFKRSNVLEGFVYEDSFDRSAAFIEPFDSISVVFDKSQISEIDENGITFNVCETGKSLDKNITSVLIPFNTELRESMRIYFPGSNADMMLSSSDNRTSITCGYDKYSVKVQLEYHVENSRNLLKQNEELAIQEQEMQIQEQVEQEQMQQKNEEEEKLRNEMELQQLEQKITELRVKLADAQASWEAANAGRDEELKSRYAVEIENYNRELQGLLAQAEALR